MDLSQTELIELKCVFSPFTIEVKWKTKFLFIRQISVIFTDFIFSHLMTQQDPSTSSEAAINLEPLSVVKKIKPNTVEI